MSEHEGAPVDPSSPVPFSEPDDELAPEGQPVGGGRRRARRRSGSGCIPVLVVLVVLAVAGFILVPKAISTVKDHFASAADYPGPGSGRVTFEVSSGDSAVVLGQRLKADGVVASVKAFTDAAAASIDPVQPGIFVLKKQMKAADAVAVLVDRANDKSINLTFLPGKSVDEIVGLLAKNTDFSRAEYEKVLAHPTALGLPDYAGGNAEGYLYPSQYVFGPDDTPTTILSAMVAQWKKAAAGVDLEGAASRLGYTPQELMTVASMVQAEGRTDVQPKIARVIYNRLEIDGNPSAGFLQIDATVNYALGQSSIARLTQAQIDSVASSPYNTYTHKGLPPTPIESPSASAMEAAAHPADGPWFFYVTVDLKTGETKFTASPTQFAQFRAQLDQYCATQSDRC